MMRWWHFQAVCPGSTSEGVFFLRWGTIFVGSGFPGTPLGPNCSRWISSSDFLGPPSSTCLRTLTLSSWISRLVFCSVAIGWVLSCKAQKGRQPRLPPFHFTHGSLADVASTIFPAEGRARLTDEAVVVAAVRAPVISVISVAVGVAVMAERSGCNGARCAERAAYHARGGVGWPESAIAMIDARLILMDPDGVRSRCRIPRQGRRCDGSAKHCGCG